MTDWFKYAQLSADKSSDPSTKVGAVIVNADGALVSLGINRFPAGVPDSWWHDRPLKYSAVVHAEQCAILFGGGLFSGGATMYSSQHPCRDCAKLIAISGITKVVCPKGPWRDDPAIVESCREAAAVFKVCGIEVEYRL